MQTATHAGRLTLAHQDDLYFPACTERSLAPLDAHDTAVACFTGYAEVDDDGRVTGSKLSLVKHLLDRVVLGRRTVVSPTRLRALYVYWPTP